MAVVDDSTRECLALVAHMSLSGARVVWELDAIAARRNVSDNGTELTSMTVLKLCHENRVGWHYIAPGKPMRNGFIAASQWLADRAAAQEY